MKLLIFSFQKRITMFKLFATCVTNEVLISSASLKSPLFPFPFSQNAIFLEIPSFRHFYFLTLCIHSPTDDLMRHKRTYVQKHKHNYRIMTKFILKVLKNCNFCSSNESFYLKVYLNNVLEIHNDFISFVKLLEVIYYIYILGIIMDDTNFS